MNRVSLSVVVGPDLTGGVELNLIMLGLVHSTIYTTISCTNNTPFELLE